MKEQKEINEQGMIIETLREKTPVFISGLPGKMQTLIAEELAKNGGYDIFPFAQSSKRHNGEVIQIGERQIKLNDYVPFNIRQRKGVIAVDFSTPQSATLNAHEYALLGVPFVMGTTGGNREEMEKSVRESSISAVIAPNMAVEVVAIQDELNDLLSTSPREFEGWRMTIRESHQAAKKDVSGTAIAFRRQLETLGAVMDGEIEFERRPNIQKELGIQNLDGHAYHWITLTSPEGVIKEYKTSIEGRQPYIIGTLMAIDFLNQRMREGSQGKVFTMSDVIRGRRQHE